MQKLQKESIREEHLHELQKIILDLPNQQQHSQMISDIFETLFYF
jgi:hypothetical protein